MRPVATYEVPQLAGPFELAVANTRAMLVVLAESRAEVAEIIEAVEEKPGAKALLFADEGSRFGDAAPDQCSAVQGRVDGDDAGCRVPAPEPIVLPANAVHMGDSSLGSSTLGRLHAFWSGRANESRAINDLRSSPKKSVAPWIP